jgi:hypothetical protein
MGGWHRRGAEARKRTAHVRMRPNFGGFCNGEASVLGCLYDVSFRLRFSQHLTSPSPRAQAEGGRNDNTLYARMAADCHSGSAVGYFGVVPYPFVVEYRLGDFLFLLLLLTFAVPGQITVVPLFIIMVRVC